jgi:transcriptional regulator with XRE-family HTH domain
MAERKANGSSIASLRKALGIKQVDLAARVAITPAYLSQIESGARKQPEPDVVRRIADELGVPLDSITYPVPDEVPS